MSDLYIMFNEAYDAATYELRFEKFAQICKHFKLELSNVLATYLEYIDSDQFYAERGM